MKELDGKLVLMTERLLVRRWMPDDLEPLLRIYGDVEAMRWVGDGVALTPQQAANWLEVTANNYRGSARRRRGDRLLRAGAPRWSGQA
jgi:RimJ/RimL family protein N-acetyltransferase